VHRAPQLGAVLRNHVRTRPELLATERAQQALAFELAFGAAAFAVTYGIGALFGTAIG